MTKDEALAELLANIDQAIIETLCSKRTNFFQTMVSNDFRISGKITVHTPEKLKDTVIEHYKKNGFTVTGCGKEIQIGW
ncbi:MAG TPA: hypothetical protein HA306_06535 [Methanosarcina sp.]|nr:hypothetical protein [Methanosarcina sp.]